MPIKYYIRKNNLTSPHSFYAQPVPISVLSKDIIASIISAKNPQLTPSIVEACIDIFADVIKYNLIAGYSINLHDFMSFRLYMQQRLANIEESIDREKIDILAIPSSTIISDVKLIATYEKLSCNDKAPTIQSIVDAVTGTQNWIRAGYAINIQGENLNYYQSDIEQGVFLTSPAGNTFRMIKILFVSAKKIIGIPDIDPVEGPAGKASVDYGLTIKSRYTETGTIKTGSFAKLRKTNIIDIDNSYLFVKGPMSIGSAVMLSYTGDYTIAKIVAMIRHDNVLTIAAGYLDGDLSSAVEITGNGNFIIAGFNHIEIQITDYTTLVSIVIEYQRYLQEICNISPIILFHTNNNGSSSFDPQVVKSGNPVSWDLGNGVRVINNNSVNYSGYTDSSVKTVKIFNIDEISNISRILVGIDNMIGALFPFDNLINLNYFECYGNQLTGSIPNLTANIKLATFSCGNNQFTGSIPSLTANINLTAFYCVNNQLTGSIPNLTANIKLATFSCNGNQLTDYSGGLSSCTKMSALSVHNNILTQKAVSDIIDDLWIIRVQIGALLCYINVGGTGNSAPDADAIAKIEGTGDYAGDGLKTKGCIVTYNV